LIAPRDFSKRERGAGPKLDWPQAKFVGIQPPIALAGSEDRNFAFQRFRPSVDTGFSMAPAQVAGCHINRRCVDTSVTPCPPENCERKRWRSGAIGKTFASAGLGPGQKMVALTLVSVA